MHLKHITLQNFRKFPALELDFNEGKNELKAANKWGKTSIADAIAFVLTGKLNNGSSDLASLKPIHDTALKVAAELTFATGWDGADRFHPESLVLRKEYFEKWTTTRGTTDQVLTGHETLFYINTVRKTAQDFEKEILQYFNLPTVEWVQILVNPFYFASTMPWAKRREIIFSIIGEIAPNDIYAAEPLTRIIAEDLKANGFSTDNLRKAYLVQKKDKKARADILAAQVEGATVPEIVTDEQFTAAEQLISANLTREVNLKAQKSGIKNPVVVALQDKLGNQISTLNDSVMNDTAELGKQNAELNDDIRKQNDIAAAARTDKGEAVQKRSGILGEIAILDNADKTAATQIAIKEAQIAVIKQDGESIKAEAFKGDAPCPTCGRPFDEDHAQAALEAFNLDKANRLTAKRTLYKQTADELAALKKGIEDRKPKREELNAAEAACRTVIKTKEDEANAAERTAIDLRAKLIYRYESDTTKAIKEAIEATKAAIREAELNANDTAEIDRQINDIRTASAAAQAIIDRANANRIILAQKATRERDLTVLRTEIADIESKDDALTIYVKTLLVLMTEKTKAALPHINVRLWIENIKAGSWEPDCTIIDDNGVPFDTTNTASKFRLGIAAIEDLKAAKNLYDLPILLDDAEHITDSNRNFSTNAQTIAMIALAFSSLGHIRLGRDGE